MPTLAELIRALPARPDPAALRAGFVPPPRFADKRFAGYRPDPAHPSQGAAVSALRAFAAELRARADGVGGRLRRALGRRPRGRGVYLDGGFGTGKTHLLAALWHEAPRPAAYLSFDELVYAIGLLGVAGARETFRGMHLVCVDEWELDDPGNLKLALAFLRGALADGVSMAATSNTVPDELGRGRFDQKNFQAEIEELAAAFRTVPVDGPDFRHRRFEADPGAAYFLPPDALDAAAAAAPAALRVDWGELLRALGEVHPIRYPALAAGAGSLWVAGLAPIAALPDGLRWVHFVDKVYDAALPFGASAEAALGELFPRAWLAGAYGKKFSRCLSRMEELLGETRAALDGGGAAA